MEDHSLEQQEPPKIEFPCDYPIKVLGSSHAPGFDQLAVTANTSSKGTFTSLTITITATGPEQLEALHQDLLASGHVKMVI